jgi:hypothetical protein
MPTNIEKENMIEHIVYEINMFKSCCLILDIVKEKGFCQNVLIESFLLHARNLYHFFYKERKDDDVIADDYISDVNRFLSERTKEDKLKKYLNIIKCNKMLAHLTYSRLHYIDEMKNWYYKNIFLSLRKTIKAFYDSIYEDYKEQFKKELYLKE